MTVRSSRPRTAAPWVRTRLRAAPGTALALALLVAVTAFLAAALPRAVDRYGDDGLRRAVTSAGAARTVLQFAAPPDPQASGQEAEASLRGAALEDYRTRILDAADRTLPLDPGQSAAGVRSTEPQEMREPWLPRPDGLPPRLDLIAQSGLAEHARLEAGRWPRAAGDVTARTPRVEAAVSAETARRLNIEVGSVLRFAGEQRAPLAVRVTGIVAPRDPRGAYWSVEPLTRTPALTILNGDPDLREYWKAALLLPPDAAPALLGTATDPYRYWNLVPSVDALHAHDVPRLKTAVASTESGPVLQRVREKTSPVVSAGTDLDEVLIRHERLRAAIGPLVAVAAFGTAAVATVVLMMAGGLAADRRRAELALLRARGGSLAGLGGRLLAETSVVALPAAALGLTAACLAVPGARLPYAVAAAGAVALLGCLALPVRAVAAHRAVRVHTGREDLTAARPSRRRTVAELTLLVLAVGAVVALRTRGTADGSGASGDHLVSLAPVLVGVIAALLLVRLYPLPLRALARPARRLRGVVGPLSLARAGRGSGSAVLPLLALLTALTTAAFGGSVLSGVADARDRTALHTVGADARVESLHVLPADLADRVRRAEGVEDVTVAGVSHHARPQDGWDVVPVAAVDPGPYAAHTRRTDIGAFDARVLETGGEPSGAGTTPGGGTGGDAGGGSASGSGAGGADGGGGAGSPMPADASARADASAATAADPLPAVASPKVAERFGTRPFPVRMEDRSIVTLRIVAVRERTPAVVGDQFLVVDRAGLSARAARPTTLLVTGDAFDPAALRRTVGDGTPVLVRAEERARHVDSPLQSGAERVYTAAVTAGAGYAVLALLLTLVRAAPERAALLARLRTMGLTRAQGRRLLVLESLPQALLAAVGGTLTAWASVVLLSPGLDLTTMAVPDTVSSPGRAALRTDPVSLLVPALVVVALTVGVAVVQAWWTGRRSAVRELRAGDAR
ncbi:FtsX-like permease family protein [Streptomyces sp. bgisy022]|uniref:FtsX-like permease family protein n=1 Tax=Streptomyces sp. bgisy022 TaxID=3413769 RepID=UPI003D7031CB